METFHLDNENMVDLFIKNGANINTKADDGTTPLHWAAMKGNFLYLSMKFGKKIRQKTRHFLGNEKVANYLIKNGANVHGLQNDCTTTLHCAATSGKF